MSYIFGGIRRLFLHAQKSKKRQKRDGMTVHLKNGKSGKPGRKTASDCGPTAERGRWRLAASFRGGKWQRERRGAGRWK